jgi:hypothetical protein
MNIGNCLRFVVFVCFICLGYRYDDVWTTVRNTSDDERSINEPDARWRRCEELRTSQCVVSHIAPFSLPLGVCHVVTCLCFLAFVGMLFELFWSHRFFCIKLYVRVYIM